MHTAARAVGIELGDEEQRQAFGAGRRVRQARQHQVHDVVGEVVLATRDENFGATDSVLTIGQGDRFGSGQAQVRARVRLGQAHGGQPFAGGHFLQVLRFEFVAGVVLDALVSAMQQSRGHGPAHVGCTQHFIEHGFEHRGQALTTVFGAGCQCGPARLPEGLVSGLEAWRHGHCAVRPLRADFVAVAVERGDDFAHKLACFTQHLLHQVRVHLGEGGQGLQLGRRVQNAGQQKLHVVGAGLVGVHDRPGLWAGGGGSCAGLRLSCTKP